MTKHEVEVEHEKLVKETEQEAFILCDLCSSELEPGEEIRFYASHEQIDAIDLCQNCLDDSPKSISNAVSLNHPKRERSESGALIDKKLVFLIISTFITGFFMGTILL